MKNYHSHSLSVLTALSCACEICLRLEYHCLISGKSFQDIGESFLRVRNAFDMLPHYMMPIYPKKL